MPNYELLMLRDQFQASRWMWLLLESGGLNADQRYHTVSRVVVTSANLRESFSEEIVILSLSASLLCHRTQESTCRPPPLLQPAILCVLNLTAAPEGPGAVASPAAPHLRPPVRVTPGARVTQLILSLL